MTRRRQGTQPLTGFVRFQHDFFEFAGGVILALQRLAAMWLLIRAHRILDAEFHAAFANPERWQEWLAVLQAATMVGFGVIYLVLLMDAIRLFSSDMVGVYKTWRAGSHEQQSASSPGRA